MDKELKTTLDGRELTIARARFGAFISAESAYERFYSAVKKNDSGKTAEAIVDYISATSELTVSELNSVPWPEIIKLFIELKILNALPEDIPILSLRAKAPDKAITVPWNYEGRAWFVWVHLMAREYGWSRETILDMDPADVAQHIQEILIDDQLDKEWTHSLSQVAYSYDKKGKASFNPLPRPVWMRKDGTPRKVRLRKDALPQGVIKDLSGIDDDKLESVNG